MQTPMTLDEYFAGFESSRPLFEALNRTVLSIGPSQVEVGKSQIAFRAGQTFAWAWVPDRYLHGHHAPLVLSVALGRRVASGRWKQVVEPSPGRFMHHLELYDAQDIDAEVRAWLAEAREVAATR